MPALGGVVVDDVENDFEAGRVQRATIVLNSRTASSGSRDTTKRVSGAKYPSVL
jgi:hypothetical protein